MREEIRCNKCKIYIYLQNGQAYMVLDINWGSNPHQPPRTPVSRCIYVQRIGYRVWATCSFIANLRGMPDGCEL